RTKRTQRVMQSVIPRGQQRSECVARFNLELTEIHTILGRRRSSEKQKVRNYPTSRAPAHKRKIGVGSVGMAIARQLGRTDSLPPEMWHLASSSSSSPATAAPSATPTARATSKKSRK